MKNTLQGLLYVKMPEAGRWTDTPFWVENHWSSDFWRCCSSPFLLLPCWKVWRSQYDNYDTMWSIAFILSVPPVCPQRPGMPQWWDSACVYFHSFASTVSGLFRLEIHGEISWISSWMISPPLFWEMALTLCSNPFKQIFIPVLIYMFLYFLGLFASLRV